MRVRDFLLVCSLLGMGFGGRLGALKAQVLLQEPSGSRTIIERPVSVSRDDGPDTLSFSQSQPFFDDFSYPGPWPDINLWFVDNENTPTINRNAAVSPPSYGIATFDGARQNNEVYASTTIASGTADRLLSHYIDLASFSPGNSLMLSFFLQPQGLGEAPESTDSFKVFFRTNQTGADEYEQVFAVAGSNLRNFRQYTIRLDQARYFHTGFQMRFESFGSLNGPLDTWHLDYVFLGAGRSDNDTVYQDLALAQVLQLPLAPYTAIPIQHFENLAEPMTNPEVETYNFRGSNQTANIEVSISDPVGGSPMAGIFARQRNVTVGPFASSLEAFPAFDEQILGGIGSLDMEVALINDGDTRPQNNLLVERTRVDSLIAYDDGEADAGFGLNVARGFGMEVELTEPDTLTAIWLHFVPFIHYNGVTGLVTYLKDRAFRLAVWDDPHPDSLLVQQSADARVRYGRRIHTYQRYPLSRPTAVPTRFWVGIQQTNNQAIGLGFDKTYNRQSLMFYDSTGVWTNLPLEGTLMIRPEFKNERPVPADIESGIDISTPVFRLGPNPGQPGQILRLFSQGSQFEGSYYARLFSIQGQMVAEYPARFLQSGDWEFRLPTHLKSGLYLWKHTWKGFNGQIVESTEKLWIR